MDDEDEEFDFIEHPVADQMLHATFGLDTDLVWKVLSMPMEEWDSARHDHGGSKVKQDVPPCFRVCFSAPEGWVPAPEGTLAAAMMRSLAYGTGPERLDTMLVQAINAHIDCLARMQEELEAGFHAGLRESGYTS